MKFILNYVNTNEREIYLDRAFSSHLEIEVWIKANHPNFTSYGMTVLA